MKFKFANGHSVNIWDSEYERIVISEGRITCTRPGGKIAIIEIPKQWMEETWPKPENRREGKGLKGATPEEIRSQEEQLNRVSRSSDPASTYVRTDAEKEGTPVKFEPQREGMDFKGGTSRGMHSQDEDLNMVNREPAPTGTNDRSKAKVEKFENTKELNLNYSKLANQIEALKSDLIRFTTKTNEQLNPLLTLPKKLDDSLRALAGDVISDLNPIRDDIESLQEDIESLRKSGSLQRQKDEQILLQMKSTREDIESLKKSQLMLKWDPRVWGDKEK